MTQRLPAVWPALSGQIDQRLLTGTWFVARTTLGMWRTWDQPSITYAPLPTGQIVDTVRATRGRQQRLIIGIDTPQAAPATFEWRGVTPLTRWATSRWQVVAHDPEATDWLVTLFERTPFTASGLDICTRLPYLLPDLEHPLLALLGERPDLAPFVEQLFSPRQSL